MKTDIIIPCVIIQKFADCDNITEKANLNLTTNSIELSNGSYSFLTDSELLDMENDNDHITLIGWEVSFNLNGNEYIFDINPVADNSDIEEYEEWKIRPNQPEYKAFKLSYQLNESLPSQPDIKRHKI